MASAKDTFMRPREGFALVIVLYVLAGVGTLLFVAKPKWLSGDSKRASTAAATTEKLITVTTTQNAKAGAVLAEIGQTNTEAPDSPQKRVIARFVPIGLSFTGAPDPDFMLELEKLKTAELSGKLQEADKINGALLKDAADTRRELTKAVAGKRASDLSLEQEAAERLGAERQRNWAIMAFLVAGGLYLYVKFTHVSPGAMAQIVTDLRTPSTDSGSIQAVDASTTRIQQWMINLLAKLKAKL